MCEIFWKGTESDRFQYFLSMTDAEARVFFDKYVACCSKRLELLNRRYYEMGGGNESDLDFGPESLESLWTWATPQLRTREFSPNEIAYFMSLPESIRSEKLSQKYLSIDSLILLNDIAYYFAECLIHGLIGVHWKICKTKIKRYIDANQPVLGGFIIPINPRGTVLASAMKTLRGREGTDALQIAYEKCFNLLGEEVPL